jgi:hypothetical protein
MPSDGFFNDTVSTSDHIAKVEQKLLKTILEPFQNKSVAICGKIIQRAKVVIDDTIIEEVTDFIYLGNMISELKTDITT